MLLVIIISIIIVGILKQVQIVPHKMCYVVERFGKFYTIWDDGIHVKIPIADRIVKKISKKEQVYDFPPQDVITKDNVTISIDSVVYASVFDPELYTYGIDNPIVGLQNLTATTLRSIIGAMELDQTLSSRSEINNHMRDVLDEATDQWGIKVSRIEVKNIKPPSEIEEVMTKQMRAERERRQTVLEAQAHKESVVSRAEGDKQAKLLAAEAERDAQIALAEGQAKAIKLVYDAEAEGIRSLVDSGIDENVLKLKSIEVMKDVANGRATKIFIPNDLTGSIGSASVFGEAFRGFTDVDEKMSDTRKECVKMQLKKDACLNDEKTKETVKSAIANANIEHDLHKKGNKKLCQKTS